MKPTYKRYIITTALVWSGSLIVFVFAYMLALAPQQRTRRIIETQLAEKKQICESATKAAQKETRLKLSQQIESLKAKLQNFALDFEDTTNLTLDISRIANEKHLDLFSIKTRDSKKIPNTSHLYENKVYVSFTGGFRQFVTFLNTLERHRPVVFIDEFSISRSNRDGAAKEKDVNMTLAVLVQKPEQG